MGNGALTSWIHRPIDSWGEGRKIVCLCGSTRFIDAFQKAMFDETLAGNIVLTIGCDAKRQDITESQKQQLDALHLNKIELADEILVLNVDGYIGESTHNEIVHAHQLGKDVRYLEPRAGNSIKVLTTVVSLTGRYLPPPEPWQRWDIVGERGTGKTYTALYYADQLLKMWDYTFHVLVVTPSPTNRSFVWNMCRDIFGDKGLLNVQFYSTREIASMRGLSVGLIVADNVDHWLASEGTLEDIQTSLRGKPGKLITTGHDIWPQ